MYPNIKLDLGLRAIKYWLQNYPELLHQRFSVDFVLEALELVLNNSNFQFNNSYFALISGTARGTPVAPTYVNLTMGFLEIQLYKKVKEKYGEGVEKYVIKHWKRFLDDGQIMWKKSFGEISEFIEILNGLDENIQFTYECSEVGLPYLNLFIYKDNGKLLTDIYYKDTDSHEYLPNSSCHPRHTRRNIPYTLARNIYTIVDDPGRLRFRLNELYMWLRNKNYSVDLINSSFSSLSKIDKKVLRTPTTKESDKLLVFVQTHNPKNPQVFGKMLEKLSLLRESEKYKNLFEGVEIIKSERQPQNLGQMLQHSNVVKPNSVKGCKKCNITPCATCPFILQADQIYFSRTDILWNIMKTFNCNSGNIIYKITCNGCFRVLHRHDRKPTT